MAREMWTLTDGNNVSQWDREVGYYDGADRDSYPVRVFSARQKAELKIRIFMTMDEYESDYRCRKSGFRIFLHTPGQILSSRDNSIYMKNMEYVSILLKPKQIITSKDLLSYSPEERKCFFSTERRLRFFKYYSQQNCETECLADYTLKKCGCVKFSMPSIF